MHLKFHAGHETCPRTRRSSSFSRLLCTTALVSAALIGSPYVSTPAHAQVVCDLTAGRINVIDATNLTGAFDETLNILACQGPITSGLAPVFDGIDFHSLVQTENLVTVRGNVDITSTSETASAETRGLRFNVLNGGFNIIRNYADISSVAISTRDMALAGGGATKSFGIFTENWDSGNNALLNYGNIFSSVDATGATNAHEPHGIRMGEWNGVNNYFENHGDIVLSGIANGSTGSNSSVVSGAISNQGMNGAYNVLLNYGNITSEIFGGSGTAGRGIAVTRGINLANFTNWGQYQYVANYGVMNLYAKGGDDNPGDSYAEAAGILHRGTELRLPATETWTERATIILENHGEINITLDGPTTNNGGLNENYVFGIYANQLDTGELGWLNNTGTVRMRGTTYLANEPDRYIGIGTKRGNQNTILENSGLIDIQYTSQTATSTAVGMGTWSTNYFQGLLYNEGKIVVRALAEGQAWAIRMMKVENTNPAQTTGVGIDFPDETSTVHLSTRGFLEGKIGVGGHDVLVDHSAGGNSVHWTVEEFVNADVSFKTAGAVFLVENNVDNSDVVVTFDTSMIESQDEIIASFSRAGRMAESAYVKHAMHKSPDASGPVSVWGTLVGSHLKTDGSDRNALDTDTQYGGAVGGFIGVLNPDIAISLNGGILTGDTEIDSRWMQSSESDITTYFAGTTLTAEMGAFRGHLGARAGRTDFDHARNVNNNLVFGGIEQATGDQSATWTSVSGHVG